MSRFIGVYRLADDRLNHATVIFDTSRPPQPPDDPYWHRRSTIACGVVTVVTGGPLRVLTLDRLGP